MKFFFKETRNHNHLCRLASLLKTLRRKCWREEKGGPSISRVFRLLWESSHSPGNLLWVICPVWEMHPPWSHRCPVAWLLGDQWSALVVRQMGMHFMGITLWVVRLPTDSPVRMPVCINLESAPPQTRTVLSRADFQEGMDGAPTELETKCWGEVVKHIQAEKAPGWPQLFV